MRRSAVALLVLVIVGSLTGASARVARASVPLPQTQFYLHQDTSALNQLDDNPTFDTAAPTAGFPAFASASETFGLFDAQWSGAIDGEIDVLKVDFFQKAPACEAASLVLTCVNYNVVLQVGAQTYTFPTFTETPSGTGITRVTHFFSSADADSPLPIDAAGQPVSISIAGQFIVNEFAATIVYDSVDFPSGFVVNPPLPASGIPPVSRTPGSASFDAPVVLPGSDTFGEPSIDIARPGTKEAPGAPQTVWVSAPRGTLDSKLEGHSSPVWRSDDGGATWVGPITTANALTLETGLGGGDTDIKTDIDGNVYQLDLWLGNDTTSISQDKGQTWIGSPASHLHFGDDRAWFGYSAKENALYMTYDGLEGVFMDKADLDTIGPDGALLFSQESLVVDNATRLCVCSPGSLFVDDSRPGALPYVYVVLGTGDGIKLYRSADGGLTFTNSVVPKSGQGTTTALLFQVGTVDADGTVYVAWAENKGGTTDVFFASSSDHGQSWIGPFNVSAPIGASRTALMPAIAAEGSGHVGLAFYGTDATVDPDTAPDDTSWNVYYEESTNAASGTPQVTLTNIVPDFHLGQICTGGTTCSGDRSLLDFFSVAFNKDRLANIIYTTGDQNHGVKLAFTKELSSGTPKTPTALVYAGDTSVDSGANASYGATLTDSGGLPVAGATVSFKLGSLGAVTATTDANGVAVARQQVTLAPGTYTVAASFAGDAAREPSADSAAFTVTQPEPAIGDISVVRAGPTNGGGEPSMALGPEGNLYVSYPGSGMNFFRSSDGGATWTAGAKAAASSGDTSVNADSSGAVYESNLVNVIGTNTFQADVYKSLDFGAHWTKGQGFLITSNASNNPALVDRQWVDAYVPPGKTTNEARVYLTYHDFGPSQIWVNVSKDGGRTFGQPVDVVQSPEAELASFCNTVPGGVKVVQSGPHAGRVYAAWLAADLPTNLLTGCNLTQLDTFHSAWIAWSDDEGATWTNQLVFDGGFGHDASALFADLTLDNQGNPYVAFGDNLTGEWDMFLMASFDDGRTWNGKRDGTGTPYKVNADAGTHFFPAVAAGDPGRVDVAYIATDVVIPVLPYGKPQPGGGDGAEWRVYLAQSTNLLAGSPTWKVQAVRPEAIHVGDVCTLGLFCEAGAPLGADRDLLDFIDLVTDAGGFGHVTYTDDHNVSGIYVGNQVSGPTVLTPSIAFTADTPSSGAYSAQVTAKARVQNLPTGTEVVFTLGPDVQRSPTGDAGVASVTFDLSEVPGSYTLTASADGVSVSETFTVQRAGTSATLAIGKKTLSATLISDVTGLGVSGRTINFYVNGILVGQAVTAADGTATLRKKTKSGDVVRAVFAGDTFYAPSEVTRTG